MMNPSRLAKNLALLFSLTIFCALFNACGAHKAGVSSSADFSSRSNPDDQNISDGGLITECSGFDLKKIALSGATTTYYNSQGAPVTDLIRLRIRSYPLPIINKSTYYLQFFRWGYTSGGQRVENTQATPLWFQVISTGQYLNTSAETRISRNVIAKLITDNNLSQQGITPDNFLERVMVVLDDVSLDYDAVTVGLFDSAVGTTALNYESILLPAFSANPNTYAKLHPQTELQILHPNYSIKNQALSDAAFLDQAEKACENFL